LVIPAAALPGRLTGKSGKGTKSFLVSPFGASSARVNLQPRIVDNCTDESDAKQVYFHANGLGEDASRYAVTVAPNQTAA
jgi:hypothetical protein